MKTDIKHIATITATAIWADGYYDEAEKVTVAEIADALELDEAAFVAAVDAAVAQLESKSEEEAAEMLTAAAAQVDNEEVGIVFEVAMQMLLADGELSRSEVSNLLAVADALGIETEDAILLLADMVKDEETLTINMEE